MYTVIMLDVFLAWLTAQINLIFTVTESHVRYESGEHWLPTATAPLTKSTRFFLQACTHTHHPVAWERSHPMRTVEVRLSVQIYSAEVLFQMFDIHELLSFSLLPDDRNAKQMLSVSLSLPPSLINPLAECLKMGRWESKVCQKHQMTVTEVTV